MTDRSPFHQRLRAEARAPYRPLRKFIYIALGGSGLIGAVVFFFQLLGGRGETDTLLANLALQVGATIFFSWLFIKDRDSRLP